MQFMYDSDAAFAFNCKQQPYELPPTTQSDTPDFDLYGMPLPPSFSNMGDRFFDNGVNWNYIQTHGANITTSPVANHEPADGQSIVSWFNIFPFQAECSKLPKYSLMFFDDHRTEP